MLALAVGLGFLQSGLSPDEQQPVVTLWTTGSTVAAPLGLLAGGPLIALTSVHAALVLSGLLTPLLAPLAAWGVLPGRADGSGASSAASPGPPVPGSAA